MMKAFVSWSGGKESCFACYKAIQNNIDVSHIINSISKKHNKVCFHGIKADNIQIQSKAIGIPLIQSKIAESNYEQKFKKTIQDLKKSGITGGIFGDIDIQEHRDWVERVCDESNVTPVFPLWKQKREQLLNDFLDEGFEATIILTKASSLGKKWLGSKINKNLISELSKIQVDLCGENGEYHTFVTNGPLFKRPIKIIETGKSFREGYWFLNIERCVID